MIFADWTRAGIVLCMLLVRGPAMVWLLYTLLFLETLMWALFEPGHNAVIPNIAREDEVVTANTLSSMTWSMNFAIGFSLGGIAAAWLGREAVFVLNAGSFVSVGAVPEPDAILRAARGRSPAVEGARFDGLLAHRRRNPVRDARSPSARDHLREGRVGFHGRDWVLVPIFGERVFPLHGAGSLRSKRACWG